VTAKTDNTVTLNVVTNKAIDSTVASNIKDAVATSVGTTSDHVTLDVQQNKKRVVFQSTVTATINEATTSGAFVISGLMSLLVAFALAALF